MSQMHFYDMKVFFFFFFFYFEDHDKQIIRSCWLFLFS